MFCPHCGSTAASVSQMQGQTVACTRCGGRFVMQAEAFDPYYTWLGIPPAEQPPDHYRLLGLQRFETNAAAIENAADRQMRHLHSMRTGVHAAQSQRLLNEVSAARVCLLDPGRKAAYDDGLRKPAGGESPFAAVHAPVMPRAATLERPRAKASRGSSLAGMVTLGFVVLGGFVGLGIGVLAIFYLTGQDFLGWSGRLRPKGVPVAQRELDPAVPAVVESSDVVAAPAPRVVKIVQPLPPDAQPVVQPERPLPRPEPAIEAMKKAAPPVARAPQRAAQPPLANLPESRGLPELDSPRPMLLFELAAEPVERMGFVLLTEAAELPPQSRLLLEPDASGHQWRILFAEGEPNGRVESIATLERSELDVSFAWNEPLDESAVRRQLANCLLEVRVGDTSRVMQLREPVRSPPVVLDLESERQALALELVDPPAPGRLNLRIGALENFVKSAELRGQVDTVPVGKAAVIEFEDLPGAEIEVRLFRNSTSGKLEVRTEPVFRERGEREFELTRQRLDAMESAVQASLGKFHTQLVSLQSNLETQRATLRNLSASQPANLVEARRRQNQVKSLNGSIAKTLEEMARVERQMPRLRTRLAAVPEVRAFINALHERAAIHFVVAVPCGERELVLIDGREPASSTRGAE